jgi:co-chaperonin GroES (HSP10)
MKECDILKGEPINGHILIKVDLEQIKEELNLPSDSRLELPESYQKAIAHASDKGTIVKMAADAFGTEYKKRFGSDTVAPKVGDRIHFVSYQSKKMDRLGEYYLVTDDSIKFIESRGV